MLKLDYIASAVPYLRRSIENVELTSLSPGTAAISSW
jgi:hypothetical protein